MSNWTPQSWRQKPISQVPSYPDCGKLTAVEAQLAKLDALTPAAGDHHNEAQMRTLDR